MSKYSADDMIEVMVDKNNKLQERKRVNAREHFFSNRRWKTCAVQANTWFKLSVGNLASKQYFAISPNN